MGVKLSRGSVGTFKTTIAAEVWKHGGERAGKTVENHHTVYCTVGLLAKQCLESYL